MDWATFWEFFEKPFYTLAGGVIGFLSSYCMAQLNYKKQQKEARKAALKQIAAKLCALANHARNVSHALMYNPASLPQIGPNPMDELLATAIFEGTELAATIQELHYLFEKLYSLGEGSPDLPAQMAKIEKTINNGLSQITVRANKEKLSRRRPSAQEAIDKVREQYLPGFGKEIHGRSEDK